MTSRIPKVIPKDGKVWRLSRESWIALWPYDSDPNIAIEKIVAGARKLDEEKVKTIVKDAVEVALAPFTRSG